jgi:hypothetical protein
MTRQELDNLTKIGQLKSEPPTRAEFDGMIDSAKKRLADAGNESLAPESRFDLAYGDSAWFCARRTAAAGISLRKPVCGLSDARSHRGRAASCSDPDIFEGA